MNGISLCIPYVLFVLCCMNASLVCADNAPASRKPKYIDVHTHVGRYYWGKELTLEGLLKLMDKHGIERACILPLAIPR